MSQKVVIAVLALMLVGGLAWFVNRTYFQPPTPGQSQQIPQNSSSGGAIPKAKVLYVIKQNAREIWQVSPGEMPKKIFTDADEREKLIKISNQAVLTNEVLAITSLDEKPFSGKLVAIDLATAKESLLKDSFSIPESWAITSDGKTLAFTRFSNTEENYGYTLYSEDRTSSNLREISQSEAEIKSPAWNESGEKIAFIRISGETSEVVFTDIATLDTNVIKKFDKTIVDYLSWTGDNLILSFREIGKNAQGTIGKMSVSGGDFQKITTFDGGIANYVFSFNDYLSFLVGQYSGKLDDQTIGQIYLFDTLKNQKIPLQKGVQILGGQGI